MALASWDDYDLVAAMMQPGVDLEVDPLERGSRNTPTTVVAVDEVIVAGQGSAPGPCHNCGVDTRGKRRHAGLCERCYRRWWRARHTPA